MRINNKLIHKYFQDLGRGFVLNLMYKSEVSPFNGFVVYYDLIENEYDFIANTQANFELQAEREVLNDEQALEFKFSVDKMLYYSEMLCETLIEELKPTYYQIAKKLRKLTDTQTPEDKAITDDEVRLIEENICRAMWGIEKAYMFTKITKTADFKIAIMDPFCEVKVGIARYEYFKKHKNLKGFNPNDFATPYHVDEGSFT